MSGPARTRKTRSMTEDSQTNAAPPGSLDQDCSAVPACCAEWTRSGNAIYTLSIAAAMVGQKYEGEDFLFCPWCGRARPNDGDQR